MNIVLVEPKIPQNTGNIARLTAGSGSKLHLVEPLGFDLSDKYLKRAGLDYWEFVDFTIHSSWEKFLASKKPGVEQLWFFSTHSSKVYTEAEFKENDYLVFGSETGGLSEDFHRRYPERRLKIPMENPGVRSFNLANSVAIALFEAKRQLSIF